MVDIGDRVLIVSECNSNSECGTVIDTYMAGCGHKYRYLMVQLDNGNKQGYSEMSVKILNRKEGSCGMEDFRDVAIVNLLDDYAKKDYGFALYESEFTLFENTVPGAALVVVNARGKENRQLGIVKQVMPKEEYGKCVSAQVVGVVNMNGYAAREEEIKRKKEIEKQKTAVEKELKERLRKLQDADFYEKMAKEYADKDPELANLVEQLKVLGE